MTRAFLFPILQTPIASTNVITTGRPSGIIETDKATTDKIISSTGWLCHIPTAKTIIAKTKTILIIIVDKNLILFLRGISVSISLILSAIFPMLVFCPVAKTTARALPETTTVPFNISSPIFLYTGFDSPVIAASSTLKPLESIIFASAGIFSPS